MSTADHRRRVHQILVALSGIPLAEQLAIAQMVAKLLLQKTYDGHDAELARGVQCHAHE